MKKNDKQEIVNDNIVVNDVKKILFVGAEAMPFAATGGLGDVIGSLPSAIAAASGDKVDIRVVMPLYGQISTEWRNLMKDEAVWDLKLAWRNLYCGVKSLKKDGVTYYFIDNEYYFKRQSLYGCYDDGERFAFFCMAVLDMMEKVGFYPDILHAHDWQSALSVIYLNMLYRGKSGYGTMKTVFTIHNIEYQGKYDASILGDIFALGPEAYGLLEYDGCLNLMKGAIECADIVSTVSPRYADEIMSPEFSHGLSPILAKNKEKLCGILNGIDYNFYNPAKDAVIKKKFSANTIAGKKENKQALQEELGLPVRDVPLLSIVSRLAAHKGIDIISDIASNMIFENDVQLVVLGTGEAKYESFFKYLEAQFPDKVKAELRYDRDLSKRIYAASDIFLMPSKSEPCGLSQMIASRYGAIPVVRETGGLYDSIKPYYEKNGKLEGNGFTFSHYVGSELYDCIKSAIWLWNDAEKREKFVKKIMKTDFSWKNSALGYLEMYKTL